MKKMLIMNNMRLCAFFCLLLSGMFLPANATAQSRVMENLSFKSDLMKKDVKYAVYLPESYATSDRKYPILYLLHGYSDDHTAWLRHGQVKQTADKQMADGTSEEMIIVMPDAKVSWYINAVDGSSPYEDMFFGEFIPYIESEYRVIAQKESRAISGLSMGGYGSLVYALHHPDMFAACCPMSAAVFTDEELMDMDDGHYERTFAFLYGKASKGKDRLSPSWNKNSVLSLIRTLPAEDKRKIKIYATCGDDDFLLKGNAALWIALREAHIPSEFRVRDGGHSWSYWRETLKEVLPTVSAHFHR